MSARITMLDECGSTNAVLADMPDAPGDTVIATRCQTAGRGQRGNSWEAEPGKNLTFSMLLRPAGLHAARQFELSMLVSLAITDSLDAHLPEGKRCVVKWPNDIYIGLEKICGILIENKLAGSEIERAIAGVGINVNQRKFLSDAPNPTSLIHHNGGRENDLDALLAEVCDRIALYCARYMASPDPAALKERYMSRLMWTAGAHPFADSEGSFMAHITDVALDGTLSLSNGKKYAFKEVRFQAEREKG